jgi:hypothetical protein
MFINYLFFSFFLQRQMDFASVEHAILDLLTHRENSKYALVGNDSDWVSTFYSLIQSKLQGFLDFASEISKQSWTYMMRATPETHQILLTMLRISKEFSSVGVIKLKTSVKDVASRLARFWEYIKIVFPNIVSRVFEYTGKTLLYVYEQMKSLANTASSEILAYFKFIGRGLKKIVKSLLNVFNTALSNLSSSVSEFASAIVSGSKAVYKGAQKTCINYFMFSFAAMGEVMELLNEAKEDMREHFLKVVRFLGTYAKRINKMIDIFKSNLMAIVGTFPKTVAWLTYLGDFSYNAINNAFGWYLQAIAFWHGGILSVFSGLIDEGSKILGPLFTKIQIPDALTKTLEPTKAFKEQISQAKVVLEMHPDAVHLKNAISTAELFADTLQTRTQRRKEMRFKEKYLDAMAFTREYAELMTDALTLSDDDDIDAVDAKIEQLYETKYGMPYSVLMNSTDILPTALKLEVDAAKAMPIGLRGFSPGYEYSNEQKIRFTELFPEARGSVSQYLKTRFGQIRRKERDVKVQLDEARRSGDYTLVAKYEKQYEFIHAIVDSLGVQYTQRALRICAVGGLIGVVGLAIWYRNKLKAEEKVAFTTLSNEAFGSTVSPFEKKMLDTFKAKQNGDIDVSLMDFGFAIREETKESYFDFFKKTDKYVYESDKRKKLDGFLDKWYTSLMSVCTTEEQTILDNAVKDTPRIIDGWFGKKTTEAVPVEEYMQSTYDIFKKYSYATANKVEKGTGVNVFSLVGSFYVGVFDWASTYSGVIQKEVTGKISDAEGLKDFSWRALFGSEQHARIALATTSNFGAGMFYGIVTIIGVLFIIFNALIIVYVGDLEYDGLVDGVIQLCKTATSLYNAIALFLTPLALHLISNCIVITQARKLITESWIPAFEGLAVLFSILFTPGAVLLGVIGKIGSFVKPKPTLAQSRVDVQEVKKELKVVETSEFDIIRLSKEDQAEFVRLSKAMQEYVKKWFKKPYTTDGETILQFIVRNKKK